MNSKYLLSFSVLCLLSCAIQAQSTGASGDTRISCKQYDSERKQFFVRNAQGDLLETGFYRSDKPDLTWIQYQEEGRKLMLAQFQNGAKQGTWYIWDEEGFLRYEIEYINNHIYHARELDRTGALVASR